MSFTNAEIRPKVKALDWRIEPIENGGSVKCWCAGPLRVIEAHYEKDASRPCRHWMSGGALDCYCLREPASCRTIGYLPVITQNHRSLVYIVPKTTCETILNIEFGEPITVSRGNWDTAPARVERQDKAWCQGLNHYSGSRYKSADIREYLFHVWQDKELTLFMGVNYYPPANMAATGGKARKRVKSEPVSDPVSLLRKPRGTPEGKRAADSDAREQAASLAAHYASGIGIDPNAGTGDGRG